MPIKIYNKLVRDKIPEIIQTSKKTCITEILPDDLYLNKLDEKLNEECAEYQESKSLEELADIIEVIYAITKARGYSLAELEDVRNQKAIKRGGFENKVLLKQVNEE